MSAPSPAIGANSAPTPENSQPHTPPLPNLAKMGSISAESTPGATIKSETCNGGPTNGGSGGSGSDEPSTRRPMKNISRERMKEETKFLRARVQELERELSQSMAKRALERCLTPAPVWKDLAKRQAARREKSEQERNRLRAKLLHQIQVAKSLETVFKNRTGAFIDEVATSAASHNAFPVDDMAQLHERFMDEVDQAYAHIDQVFTEPVVLEDAVEKTARRSTVVVLQTNGEEKLYVELRDINYVPFPFERVCSATWRAITTEYHRQQRIIEQFCLTDHEYSSKFQLQNLVPGGSNRLTAAMGMRRFQDEQRMVLVWRSVDWDDDPSTKCEYGDETGWLIVERVMDRVSGTPCNEGAIVRVCTRYVPIWEDQAKLLEVGGHQFELLGESHSAPSLLKAGEFTSRILNGTEEDIASITESIENILLDESIGTADDDDLESMVDELGAFSDHLYKPSASEGLLLRMPDMEL